MARSNEALYYFAVIFCTLSVVHGQRKTERAPLLDTPDEVQEHFRNDQLHGLYVKDNENGELRLFANNPNFNTALNQFINQQQDFWERLRPVNNVAGAQGVNGNLGGLAGTNGIAPIIVGLGQGTAGNNANGVVNGGVNGGANNNANSIIPGLLPNIIGQVVANNGGLNRRRRRRPSIQVIRL